MNLHCAQIQQEFVRTFTDRARTALRVSDLELEHLATVLGTSLPDTYREFILQFGAVYCPGILHLMTSNALERPDLRQFFTPKQVLQRSAELWSQSLPVDAYAFACDCLGNCFCFRKSPAPLADAPVMFLPRQHGELMELDASFDQLLRGYLVLALAAGIAPTSAGSP